MQQKDSKKIYQNEKTRITVKEDWCKACGICINYCPKNVLVASDKGQPVAKNIDDCIQCMLCELRCPDFAIMVENKENTDANNLEHVSLED
ncbi:MAG: 4Fe-4S dicluster domain-containing protein [Candidatus Caldatribacteriota bacterium]|jgi:2-oxoglutarate ferredoxin oxidoreductase subunit delta|nr:4Fe-4S binding protein [Atribacterota bacterium]MDD3031971.1 4Fe-4S binding protein [Atribacterota bacterium]MDD3640444.1 4Fe-4S binding protein [Atribacterota bacterium]MDD4288843.1 4Fe-4S binding protein [Atribacterota bacterium]